MRQSAAFYASHHHLFRLQLIRDHLSISSVLREESTSLNTSNIKLDDERLGLTGRRQWNQVMRLLAVTLYNHLVSGDQGGCTSDLFDYTGCGTAKHRRHDG